ncbi:hypothetical protein SAMN04488072_10424 [Lentibacillus halodurans]|uniref:Uncharacterized protein n=1 Tax=Lentibacillus halodurans TaxID=237679 RepID=A0A1I0WYQ3_9BACI|nr:hypothetical protein [Lentibacillus halodurans]SFA93869.1 hypothetical protein SAMN04488072_10424 [Lentibacillus halodurans]
MSIDHISRIVNMFSKKEIDSIKGELELSDFEDATQDIDNVIENIEREPAYKTKLLEEYKYVFKPHSSHIFTYTDLNIESIDEINFGDWTITNSEERRGVHYFFVEKDYTTKRINAGWDYINVEVKQVGIVVIQPDINVLEVRSNIMVKNQIERQLINSFINLSPLSIDRSYYTAILEELNAKEFSVLWETEGADVRKAHLEGENISVKNGAIIHIKDENGEIVTVDLGTDGSPESVWSTLTDYNAKILLSSKGNLRLSKLITEDEVNKIILKIISAVKGLPVSQNVKLEMENPQTFVELFKEYCAGTKKNVLKRFSKRYFSFRTSLAFDDTERVLTYLCEQGFFSLNYEIYCEHGHFVATTNEVSEQRDSLLCDTCETLGVDYSYDNQGIKKIYSITDAGLSCLQNANINIEEGIGDDPNRGMNDAQFNEDPIDPAELYQMERVLLKVKRQMLENAIDEGDIARERAIVAELSKMNTPEAHEIIKEHGLTSSRY